MPFPKAIITKPFLVTDADLIDLGQNINLVGYDTFGKSIENTNQYVSPKLINWVEPYEISGIKKTLFYTEVNSNLMVGDKVFIINGAYDSNSLIKKDKYKKGRDGYNVLKVENCKIVLDIDYTGISPYKDDSLDDYIKVYYIENKESFLHANRQVTTRGGKFDYKFNYGQNNVAFVDHNYPEMDNWGFNGGIIGAPGFFVRNRKDVWSNISDDLIYLGSFSVALSETYGSNGKIFIQDGDFVYNGIQFKEGFAYKWEIGPTGSSWTVDVEYSKAIITKANFRNGTFNGKFNNGLYGTQESKIEWSGVGTWNGGTILNSIWKSGTMYSKIDVIKTYKTSLDENGYPFQKSYADNNGGFGFNYIIDSEMESSLVSNGNFQNTKFMQSSGTFSVVENHVLSITQSFGNNIEKAYFDLCEFEDIEIKGGEIRNTRAMNSKFTNVKLVNSYIKKSVVKDSTYIGDGVIKILGYDEWNMSEYMNLASGEYSSIKDVNQKIYKFYISKESYKRFKSEDTFYIKGLKINDGTKKLLNFFDSKFRLTSWTEFYDDYATESKSTTGVDPYSFHKRGYECSAFLSTPEENSYIINSYETEYWYKSPNELTGGTHSKYSTTLAGKNPNAGYSIDIIVARHDIVNKNISMDKNSEWESLNPKNYNYDSDVLPGTSSVPAYLGNMIDISGAYILDADFESGIIETSDWNSGHHINYNNDVVITPVSSDGRYDLEIDSINDLLIANTSKLMDNPERIGVDVLSKGDIVFLNSVDYDTTGMVTKVSVMTTGSSYSTSFDKKLVNTSILSTTMSNYGTNYKTGVDLPTISSRSGTGVTVDIVANPIGAVLGITYSTPIISKTGLKLSMDPEFSYPGSGTSWTDLTNSYSGSLFGGVVYDSTNKAFSTLTSTSTTPRWISLNSWIQFGDGNEYSMEFSVKLRTGAEGTFHSLCGNGGFDGWIGIEGTANSWRLFFRDGVAGSNLYTYSPLITNFDLSKSWAVIGITVDSMRNIKFYLNGAFVCITAPTLISAMINISRIGGGYDDSGRYYPFQGLISTTRIYNRPLAASEMFVNYNLTIDRLGSGAPIYVPANGGPIATSFSTDTSILPPSYVTTIVTDTDGSATGVVNATYSVFGPPQNPMSSVAQGAGVIFTAGPHFTGGGMTVDYAKTANGLITNIYISDYGVGYLPGQIFKVEGGNATFSISSVSKGEIISYSIKSKGEDYINGDVLEIAKSFDPNSLYNNGITASIIVISITASSFDEKGLTLDIITGSGSYDGKITDITIKTPGLYYKEGEIFTINDGNLDAIVKIESVTGSVTRLGDTYKVVENNSGVVSLQEVATQSSISGMVSGGIFYTAGAENRWGYISKSKFDRTKIKSGLLRRAYITKSLINDINYDSSDKDFLNYERTKNLLITDSLFSNNSNILSSATYLYSNIVGGSDIWNDGIIFKSALNGMTFSKGVVRQSIWMDGDFTGGLFYDSRSFDAKPTDIKPNYLSNRARSYFFTGALGSGIFNSRYSWQKGRFSGGEFYKSDWESGIFDNGLFYYSKFYSGTFNNGVVGTKDVSTGDTKIYNGIINYAIVDNAYVYSEDPSYTGMSTSSIEWMDGVFNNGIFGSNNQDVIGTTVSNISYPGLFSALPIKDFKVATYTQSVTNNDIILNDLEITGKINLKHTYIGDLIINLMAPNGMIVNLKKRYSGGSSDNLIETNFTSDLTKPSLEISTSPHTGDFAFANVLNHGVYYKMDGTLLSNVDYQENLRSIPQVLDYASFPPNQTYEGDRYLVIATSSDPKWTANSPTTWIAYADTIVEKKYNGTWLPSTATNRNGDYLYIKNRNEYLKYITKSVVSFSNRRSTATSVNTWVKSYHSNTTNPSALMNADKTITGIWTLLVMDVAGADVGFVDDFTLNFNYKNNFIIKSFKNDAVWKNGIFNGGQFVDLGVWKNGKFNGGKFISTYGHSKSGNYLIFNKNQDDYSWQAGQFNGGEFGNESSLTNSTWFNGEFNGGVFKGKIWNNGVFLYGEFKGGSSVPVLGSDSKGTSASAFVEQFRNGYYGVWRNGVVSDKKDSFITDQKLFTTPVRAVSPVISNKKAVFTNMLWLGGIFNHPSGEMKNSAWLDGLFQMGRFESSSFNPYVKRYSDNLEFLKDDSCIWENGKLVGSEFFFSKWNYGHFISGTASGMIWKDGIADYMNAYNIFWEKGVWRNGNWNGSSFEYSGEILDGFVKEILNRGIEWSGTNSCHIWNIFETDVDKTNNMVVSNISDTFATDSQEDAGNGTPRLGATPSYSMHATQPNSVVITYHILSDSGARITQTGIVYSVTDPGINLSGGQITLVSGSSKVAYATSLTTKTISTSTYPKGMTVSNILVSGLTPGTVYKGLGYAINSEGKAYTTGLLEFEYVVKNVVSYLSPTTDQSGELAAINVAGQYSTTNSGYSKPLTKGILYSSTNANPDFTDATVIKLLDTTDNNANINVTIERADLLPATDYFIRAYAHNKAGYGYSAVQKITTGVIDPLVSIVGTITDTLSGSVTYTGGSTSLRRGFIIWPSDQPLLMPSMTNHPDSYVPANLSSSAGYYRLNAVDGGLGAFAKLISDIPARTYYKVKAFAYNPAVSGIFAWDLNPIANIPEFMSPAVEPTIGNLKISPFPGSQIMGTWSAPIIFENQVLRVNSRPNMQLIVSADLSTGGAPITESGIIYTNGLLRYEGTYNQYQYTERWLDVVKNITDFTDFRGIYTSEGPNGTGKQQSVFIRTDYEVLFGGTYSYIGNPYPLTLRKGFLETFVPAGIEKIKNLNDPSYLWAMGKMVATLDNNNDYQASAFAPYNGNSPLTPSRAHNDDFRRMTSMALPKTPTVAGKLTYTFDSHVAYNPDQIYQEWVPYYALQSELSTSGSYAKGITESSQRNNLRPNTVYYCIAYAKNEIGTAISPMTKFVTPIQLAGLYVYGVSQSFSGTVWGSWFNQVSNGALTATPSVGFIWTDVDDPSNLSWWPTYTGNTPTPAPSTNYTENNYQYSEGTSILASYNGTTYSRTLWNTYDGSDPYLGHMNTSSWSTRTDSGIIIGAPNPDGSNRYENSYPSPRIIIPGKSPGNDPIKGNVSLKIFAYAKGEGGITYIENKTNFISMVIVTLPGDGDSSGLIVHPGVFGNGTQSIIEKGIYYSTTDPLVVSGTKVVCTGTQSTDMNTITYTSTTNPARGGFTVTIPTILPGKTYYFKTYWKNSTGTSYGPIGIIKSGPAITGTIAIDTTSGSKISVSGISIANTTSSIVEWGIVWAVSTLDLNTTQIPITTDPSNFSSNSSYTAWSYAYGSTLSGAQPNITKSIMSGTYFVYARLYIKYKEGNTTTWSYSSEKKMSTTSGTLNFGRIKVKVSNNNYSYSTNSACAADAYIERWASMADGLSIKVGDTLSYEWGSQYLLYEPPAGYYKIELDTSDPQYEPLNLSCGAKATIIGINYIGRIVSVTCCP